MARKKRVAFRVFSGNRLTLPLLLNVWEREGIDRFFDIALLDAEPGSLSPSQASALRSSDACAYSFMTPHLPRIAAEIEALRASGGVRPLLVAGGPHADGDPALALACGFDVVFSGGGEAAFRRFGLELLRGGLAAGAGCIRSAAEEGGGVGDGSWQATIPVSRHCRTVPPLEISRGCFWKCRFCQTGNARPRHRGEGSIALYLEETRRRRLQRVGFISPSALEFGGSRPGEPDLPRLERLLEDCRRSGVRFIEYGIFPSEIRPDTVSPEALRLLRRYAANRRLTFGAQCASDARLGAVGRGHTTAAVERAVTLANEAGFVANLDFLIALPGETEDDRRALLDFIARVRRGRRVFIQLHHFFPISGCAFALCRPSFLGASERRAFGALKDAGLGSDGWRQGERSARAYFSWLRAKFPAFLDRFH
ncbi:MAG: TIGR04013 family B12-binding domain/radical SAM domain-containing protein [Candidatus Aminicenantes bacterium]|nr:TIGR04013 family B12-binding domain/radical SAM domain-containing protein [Candidatus Aminicenantes bacterium]